MKKVFKILGILLVLVILAGGVFAAVIAFGGIPSYDGPEGLELAIDQDLVDLERGERLTRTLCAGCHINPETNSLTGKQMTDVPKEFGTVFSSNITQDKQYGIGDWTETELIYLLRTGIKRDGTYAPPYMPKLTQMSDADLASIIAFLKSDSPLVSANSTPDRETEPSFLTKMLCRVAFKPFPMPEGEIPMPDPTNTVEVGKYLVHNLDCFSCHSADFKTNDYMNPEKSVGYLGGGNQTLDNEGNVLPTQNLTPDPTGIGNWSKEQFVKAVKYGQMEGEIALRYPMIPYTLLTDEEVGAMYDYLMTVPKIENDIPRTGI